MTCTGQERRYKPSWTLLDAACKGLLATSESGYTAMSIDRYVHVLLTLSRAVHALHEAGWLHRDIRASNVLVDCGTGQVGSLYLLFSVLISLLSPLPLLAKQSRLKKGELSFACCYYTLHTHTQTHAYTHAPCRHAHAYTYSSTRSHTHTHARARTHTHTHLHIPTHTDV